MAVPKMTPPSGARCTSWPLIRTGTDGAVGAGVGRALVVPSTTTLVAPTEMA